MDEVARIKVELDKAYSSKDGEKATELLKLLVNIPVTMMVLQETHIGAAVNKIRKSFDHQESVSLATKVVKKWKKMAEQYKQGGGDANASIASNQSSHNHHSNNANASTTNALNSADVNNGNNNKSATDLNGNQHSHDAKSRQSSNHHADSKTSNSQNQSPTSDYKTQPKPSTSDGDPGSVSNSKPRFVQKEVPATNSAVRLKFRQMICDALRKPLPKELATNQDPFLDEESLAGRIEEHIYQEFKSDSDSRYRNRVRSRICNLTDQKNPYLRLNVLRGDISAEKMAKMTADEMASDELKRQREQFTKEAINDHQMAVTSGTRSSEIKCPACKKYDCTYNQMQTRSADEPMTTFCHCNNCGKRWKFC